MDGVVCNLMSYWALQLDCDSTGIKTLEVLYVRLIVLVIQGIHTKHVHFHKHRDRDVIWAIKAVLDMDREVRIVSIPQESNIVAHTLAVNVEREPNLAERENQESMDPNKHSSHHKKETHGLNNDIDENTSIDDVRAPNVFERAKEEFQALAEVFHHKKKASTCDTRDEHQIDESTKHNQEPPNSPSANIFVRTKEEIKAMIHNDKSHSHYHHHHKETHGRNDDINESTPTNEVKGPNVYQRVKEEFEAVFQTIHPKKES
ncbi:hypothetical protein VNO78_03363 [Psophocarpus tetragonolobus]|uniref:Uncharacterized protein n=1 Tax=Psophocarpus tetragonolobus TaxID=3891 RepID=A0AAN9T108_PSOTE